MWLLKNKKEAELSESDFSIEHYPLTNRYFPKYKSGYMSTNPDTGYITTKNDLERVFSWDIKHSREDALNVIEKFKEQKFKLNVKTEYIK